LKQYNYGFRVSLGFLLCGTGVWDSATWIFVNHGYYKSFFLTFEQKLEIQDLIAAREQSGQVFKDPEISQAVRREFILNTIHGIRETIKANINERKHAHSLTAQYEFLEEEAQNSSMDIEDPYREFSVPGLGGVLVEFFPRTFSYLREKAFCTSTEEFFESFPESISTLVEKFSEGASGSLFFFTFDQRYLINTV
jgi:hypothetical protein